MTTPYVEVQYQPIRVAQLSIDIVATLKLGTQSTARISYTPTQPLTLVGFVPSVRPVDWGAYTASGQMITDDDVVVDWDIGTNDKQVISEALDNSTQVARGSTQVTLKSLHLRERLHITPLLKRGNVIPSIGFIFSWRGKYTGPGAPPGDIDIRLTLLADPYKETDSR